MWMSRPTRLQDFQPNRFVFLAPCTIVTELVDDVAVDDDVTVSDSLHDDLGAEFVSAD